MTILRFEIMVILQNIDVHQERLATAGSAPAGQLVELRPCLKSCVKRGNPVSIRLVAVVKEHLRIQRHEQRFGVMKITVKIDFSEEQGEILKILPDNRLLATRDTPLVQPLRMANNILVVLQQQFSRKLIYIKMLRGQRMVKMVDIMLIKPLLRFVAQLIGQLLKPLHPKKRKQPLIDHKLPGKRHLRLTGQALFWSSALCCSSSGHQLPSFASNMMR